MSENGKILFQLLPPAIAWGDEAEGSAPETVDASTIEDRIRDYLIQVNLLRTGLRKIGFEDEENMTVLILSFFEHEGLRG